jgi:hypothetical protein
MLLLGALLVYGLPALSSRNPLWFVPSLGAEPSQIVVYRDGEQQVYRPGSPGYQTLAPLCTKALREVGGLEDSGLSDETLREIRRSGRAIEVFFPQPVTIPTSLPVGRPDQILIPLDERFQTSAVAYTANNGKYWAQGLRIRSTYDDLRRTYDDLTLRK